MTQRDRPVPGRAAYLAARFGFGQIFSGWALGLATFGSGGVDSMRRSTSSEVGIGRLFIGKFSHG